MHGGYIDKFFVWRYGSQRDGDLEYCVCEHPPGGERKVIWPKRGQARCRSEKRAAKTAQEMNADWRRYEAAMFARAGDRA